MGTKEIEDQKELIRNYVRLAVSVYHERLRKQIREKAKQGERPHLTDEDIQFEFLVNKAELEQNLKAL